MTEEGARVWVLDDDDAIRVVLKRSLERAGYRVSTFETVAACRDALSQRTPDLLITDIRLPDDDGLVLLDDLGQQGSNVPVIAMTAFSDLDQAVAAFQQGVFDYLAKPFDLDQVLAVVERALAGSRSEARGERRESAPQLIGESAAMQEVFRTVGRLSRTDISVLITGETGSGKELVARALHRHSPRAQGPFVAINTAAIPTELLESELFGHERGAFTGAHARRTGRFEEAAGGTLFLDEIGDMPLALQTRLLRVLAEGDYYRVGGRDLLRADVRVIAATHQDLEALVRKGRFREDLYHRLNVIRIPLPPLRERAEDIPLLARHFLAQASAELGLEPKQLRPASESLLTAYYWPGNVRQLQNLCRQLVVMAPGEQVFPDDLPAELRNAGSASEPQGSWQAALRAWARAALRDGRADLLPTTREELEQILIEAALEATGGNRQEAARRLGIGRNTLTRKIKAGDHGD
ncbi:MAG: nitrogen regulation protein NR(I) [Xanthomonadales bacterium]|nr:nitrogen regulation protein NR(I) [Xanthomonadales bacterium]